MAYITILLLSLSVLASCTDGSEVNPFFTNQAAFVTTWKTDNPGFSDDDQIKIGTSIGNYNYIIDWGDGQINTNVQGDITHTYATPGTYTIKIIGEFPQILFAANTDENKILSIESWGDIEWRSMNNAFFNCINLVSNASDTPDLSQVTDTSFMFLNARSFNQDISEWDMSSVTDMSYMFSRASAFNQNINTWNVSSVTNMNFMFFNADVFNQDLSEWDVQQVTDMSFMFSNALAFNQDLNAWNVAKVTNMSGMFRDSGFNQDLSLWNVSLVTNMSSMFVFAEDFDQDISTWDISSVTDMSNMFDGVTLSLTNYDALLVAWSAQSVQTDVVFSGGNSQYSATSQAARDTLTAGFNWTMSDAGVAP